MDSNAKHLTYNTPNTERVAPTNALATCPNEEELAAQVGCQSKHQLQIVSERSAQDLGAGTSVGAQLLIRSHPTDLLQKREAEI